MALGVYGFGFEDAMTHLFNLVWPNMFEVSPHMVQAFTDAVDGMRVSVGPGKVLSYLLQVRILVGLRHAQCWLMPPPPCFRACFTRRAKYVMRTGGFTTTCTSVLR